MSVLPMMHVVSIEGDVELVGHQLAEAGAGALTGVRLADKEGGGVVLVDDDPRVDLMEIWIRIGPCSLRRGALSVGASRIPAPTNTPKLTASSPAFLRKPRRLVTSASSMCWGSCRSALMPRTPGARVLMAV